MSNNYSMLRNLRKIEDRRRCAQRLLAIRDSLGDLRQRKREGALLLATWNIRDFGAAKFGNGPRLPETLYYIAEIISCFDLVAVQEVNRNLAEFERVMEILGRDWDYIATDATEGTGGNGERMAFVYNRDKIWFRKIAGEVVLPNGMLVVSQEKASAKPGEASALAAETADATETAIDAGLDEVKNQFARTPFVVAFQAGWFKFNLCTVHIYYGEDEGPKLKRRIDEIKKLVQFFADRQDKENKNADGNPAKMENYILLGDFNVVSPDHETMKALTGKGFVVPPEIDGDAVRTAEDHFYDQIAVRVPDPRFKTTTGGIVNIYQDVFRDTAADAELYAPMMPEFDPNAAAAKARARYRDWRTWQMSDHKPLWVEIQTDYADHYLRDFAAGND
jgi:endonuclease/exonuclease/phosphatase family metal-dependent hydrolase